MAYYVLETVHELNPATTDVAVDSNSTLTEVNAAHSTAEHIQDMLAVVGAYVANGLLVKMERAKQDGTTSLITRKYFTSLSDAMMFRDTTESWVYKSDPAATISSIAEISDEEFAAANANVDMASNFLISD